MAYQYVAYTPQGEQIKGRVEASTEDLAEELLWKLNYTIVSLKKVSEGNSLFGLSAKVKTRDLIIFSRQLATLIESGIPIVRALHLLEEQTANKTLRGILAEIINDVQQGRFFSEAVMSHGKVFPDLYGRLIEVGERVGNLEMVLRQLATYLEKEEALVRKIRGAMAYPSFVIVLAIGVIFLMFSVALPPLMGLFTSFGADLPLATRVLLALTDFFSAYKFVILGALLGTALVLYLVLRSEQGRLFFDRTVLKIPLISKIIIQGAVSRLCSTMSTLLQAGLALPEILQMVIRTQNNRIIAGALSDVRSDLLQGQGLADPLLERKLFPSMLGQMVRVGEETGALDSNLETLADFYEEEVDRAVAALTGAMEPALTIFIGGLVGFIAMACISPMYSLMNYVE